MSAKRRIECFQQNLGSFLTEQKEYLANRKLGARLPKWINRSNPTNLRKEVVYGLDLCKSN